MFVPKFWLGPGKILRKLKIIKFFIGCPLTALPFTSIVLPQKSCCEKIPVLQGLSWWLPAGYEIAVPHNIKAGCTQLSLPWQVHWHYFTNLFVSVQRENNPTTKTQNKNLVLYLMLQARSFSSFSARSKQQQWFFCDLIHLSLSDQTLFMAVVSHAAKRALFSAGETNTGKGICLYRLHISCP